MDASFFPWLVINLILSLVVAKIASDRGRSFGGFFWLSFLLSFIIGLIVVLASPPRTAAQTEYVDQRTLVKCPMCAEQIRAEAKVCKHCGRDVEPQIEVLAQVEEQDRLKRQLNEQRAITSTRSNRIAVAVFMFIFSLAFVLIGLPLLFMDLPAEAKTTGLVFLGLAVGLVLWGIYVLKRMPAKQVNAEE